MVGLTSRILQVDQNGATATLLVVFLMAISNPAHLILWYSLFEAHVFLEKAKVVQTSCRLFSHCPACLLKQGALSFPILLRSSNDLCLKELSSDRKWFLTMLDVLNRHLNVG